MTEATPSEHGFSSPNRKCFPHRILGVLQDPGPLPKFCLPPTASSTMTFKDFSKLFLPTPVLGLLTTSFYQVSPDSLQVHSWLFVWFLEKGFLCIALAVLELALRSTCLCLQSAGIKEPPLPGSTLGFLKMELHYVDQAGLKFAAILLPLSPKCWD